jgi:hypothetical protein
MRFFLLRPASALATLVLLLPFAGEGGCTNDTACFTYSASEFAASGNGCPAQQDALPNFSDPNCPGPVVTVNGPGQYDGELCCYPVTFQAITPACSNGGSSGSSASFVSPPSMGVGPEVAAASATAAATSSSSGGPGGCSVTCDAALATGMAPCGGAAANTFAELQLCIGCSGGEPDASGCLSACQSFCAGGGVGFVCLSCLDNECGPQVSACMSE